MKKTRAFQGKNRILPVENNLARRVQLTESLLEQANKNINTSLSSV